MSPHGIEEGLEFLDDSAKKVDTIFWFFSVGAILMLFRAAVFTVCAVKSKTKCLQGIRMEVIESLALAEKKETGENKTEDEPTA